MFAVGWQDAKLKTIVSNRGTTHPGADSIRLRHQVVCLNGVDVTQTTEKSIPRPHVMEIFFQHFSCIDIHDHLRQGSLRLEESWKTRNWWHRIFATVFGVIVTDCYYAYKMNNTRSHLPVVQYAEFVEMLAYQLIFNTYLQRTRPRNAPTEDAENEVIHQLRPLGKLPYYQALKGNPKMRAKRRCKVCHTMTSYYCVQCSNISDDKDPHLICLCSVTSTCFQSYTHSK